MQPTTESIWSLLSSDLRRFIRRRVRDDHVADDLLQETFLRVHRNLGTLREKERLAAWVHRIARNVIHDHHRAAAEPAVQVVAADVAAADPGTSFRGVGWLDAMVRTLPEGYREAVRMAEIEELPQRDVADRLGLSLSGAKSRVQRGRALLREALLRCCAFEFDVRGRVTGCDPKPDQEVCGDCGA